MDIKTVPDAMDDNKVIESENKKAIHEALNQIQTEMAPAKKEEQKPTSMSSTGDTTTTTQSLP